MTRSRGGYVRERGLVPLEEAIAKTSGRLAGHIGLADRGIVAPGKKADVVVFDQNVVADRGTSDQPSNPPVGIRYVVVNGVVVLDDGTPTAARPGRPVRRAAACAAR